MYVVREEMPGSHRRIDPSREPDAFDKVTGWLDRNRVRVLNVAGPRASKSPDHYGIAREFLTALLG